MNPYVVSFECDRGRTSEFEKTDAGTATVLLSARDGMFDPTKAGSRAERPLRPFALNVKHPFTSTFYNVFVGYTEAYSYKRRGPRDAYTEVPLTDGFELLNQATPPGNANGCLYAAQHVDDRIRAALADANWPAARTRIASGNVDVQTIVYDHGTSILEIVQEAADAEFPGVANFFMDRNGHATFNGRGIRFTAVPEVTYPNKVKRWRVGDSAKVALDNTLLPIFDMDALRTKDIVYNHITAAPRGVEQKHINANIVKNQASIDSVYGKRKLELLDLLTLYGTTNGQGALAETKDFASYYANNYSTSRARITEIEFRAHFDEVAPATRSALWDFVLQLDIGHIVQVYTSHPGGGGFNGVDFFVEGIHHDVRNLNHKMPWWSMKLDLSPRALYASYP